MTYKIVETKIEQHNYDEKTEEYKTEMVDSLTVPCGKQFYVNDSKYALNQIVNFVNTKESLVTSHCEKCIVCKVINDKSNATVMTQQQVADCFGLGFDGKRTASDNFSSEHGILYHYSTIEAIRLKDGTVINNRECWSRGFAHCSHPFNAKFDMNLTTLRSALSFREHLTKIEIIEHVNNETLFKFEDRYFLNGIDEHAFLVELVKPCFTIKEAYESMKPNEVVTAEIQGLEVKRQGEIFFIPIQQKIKVINIESKHAIILEQPNRTSDFNHTVTKQGTIEDTNVKVVKGIVRHRFHDHKSVKLGETWHIPVLNMIKQAFNQSGRGAD